VFQPANLVQENDVFKRRPKLMFYAQPEALQVDNECKKLSSHDVFEEFVTHANVDVGSLYKTWQVSDWYLEHKSDVHKHEHHYSVQFL